MMRGPPPPVVAPVSGPSPSPPRAPATPTPGPRFTHAAGPTLPPHVVDPLVDQHLLVSHPVDHSAVEPQTIPTRVPPHAVPLDAFQPQVSPSPARGSPPGSASGAGPQATSPRGSPPHFAPPRFPQPQQNTLHAPGEPRPTREPSGEPPTRAHDGQAIPIIRADNIPTAHPGTGGPLINGTAVPSSQANGAPPAGPPTSGPFPSALHIGKSADAPEAPRGPEAPKAPEEPEEPEATQAPKASQPLEPQETPEAAMRFKAPEVGGPLNEGLPAAPSAANGISSITLPPPSKAMEAARLPIKVISEQSPSQQDFAESHELQRLQPEGEGSGPPPVSTQERPLESRPCPTAATTVGEMRKSRVDKLDGKDALILKKLTEIQELLAKNVDEAVLSARHLKEELLTATRSAKGTKVEFLVAAQSTPSMIRLNKDEMGQDKAEQKTAGTRDKASQVVFIREKQPESPSAKLEEENGNCPRRVTTENKSSQVDNDNAFGPIMSMPTPFQIPGPPSLPPTGLSAPSTSFSLLYTPTQTVSPDTFPPASYEESFG